MTVETINQRAHADHEKLTVDRPVLPVDSSVDTVIGFKLLS